MATASPPAEPSASAGASRPRSRRTQAQRRAATRQALLEATIDAVVARGYGGATVAVIAEYAGVSQGALFNHFGTKADLFGAAVEYVFPLLIDDFAIDHSVEGVTRVTGVVRDAAHLHGIVAHLTSVGAELISIGPTTTSQHTDTTETSYQ